MKRFGITTVCVTLLILAAPGARAKDAWVSVRSPNYLFVGNASAEEVRGVAARFEMFRATFSGVFPAFGLNAPVPVRVLVFRDYASYRPFRPLYSDRPMDFTGYFQPGRDVNYIVLSLGLKPEDTYAMPFHESVHLLIADRARRVPDWLNEGLAQYYSTLDVDAGRIVLGRPVARNVQFLRGRKLLSLKELFAVDRGSSDYTGGEKRDLFYAESWALIHFLISGKSGRGQLQVFRFLEMLAAGMPVERSFRQAFQADYATVERGLEEYVRRGVYAVRHVALDERARPAAELKITPLTDAEAHYYLGDLLLHVERFDDAERWLDQAVALDPSLAPAHAALGLTKVRLRRFDEAKEHLRQSLTLDPGSHLAHYYYAYALSREGIDEGQSAAGPYAPEVAREMRAGLLKAIGLEPRFPEAYHLLAQLNLVRGERLDEAVSLLGRALELSPGRADMTFVLAQVYLRQKNTTAARESLVKVLNSNANARLRAQARSLLDSMTAGVK